HWPRPLWLPRGHLASERRGNLRQSRRQRSRRLERSRALGRAIFALHLRCCSCPGRPLGLKIGYMDQREIPFAERRFRNAKFRRGIFLLPAMFTSANLLCGYYAIAAALHGAVAAAAANQIDFHDFDHAARAVGFAILFDSLDGLVARMTGTNTEFGVQFDSLADVVSFGVAPAILAYAWGFRSLSANSGINAEQLSQFGWIFCLAFLICCAWRLARFNVQGMAPGSSKFFVGM